VNIYLDTNMWDALFKVGMQPELFVPRLARANKHLVLGLHAFYESARIFQSPRPDAVMQGKSLFEFLSRYLDAKILCAKDQSELLPAEMLMLKEGPESVEFFYPRADYDKIVAECRRLANGVQSELARQFLLDQQEFAIHATKSIIAHMDANPALKKKLHKIGPDHVEDWLRKESVSVRGHSNLARHIQLRFPEIPEKEITEYAVGLFSLPMKRHARGLVRADLYLHWRYARFGAIPKDLTHDVYHVLNASYCDMYATADPKQQYAPLLLTSNTKVSTWLRDVPVDSWMESLV
jgi:hypothetical protein